MKLDVNLIFHESMVPGYFAESNQHIHTFKYYEFMQSYVSKVDPEFDIGINYQCVFTKSYKDVDDFIITVLHEIHHAIQVDKYGRKKFLKKYSQAGNMAALDGKDRYLANKWEKKAENWAQQEYRKKWKGNF